MHASIPYSNHHTFTPTSIYDSIHLPVYLPHPSIYPSMCLSPLVHTCTHPSIHQSSFYLPIHLSITYPHMHTLLHTVCKVSAIQPVLALIVWDELESALVSFPKNLGILCNRPSAGTDLASESFDSMWAILWLHSLLFPLLHEYRKGPSMELMRKKRLLNALVSLADSPVSAQRPTLWFYIPSLSSEIKHTPEWHNSTLHTHTHTKTTHTHKHTHTSPVNFSLGIGAGMEVSHIVDK